MHTSVKVGIAGFLKPLVNIVSKGFFRFYSGYSTQNLIRCSMDVASRPSVDVTIKELVALYLCCAISSKLNFLQTRSAAFPAL